jgi:hypothetical protein
MIIECLCVLQDRIIMCHEKPLPFPPLVKVMPAAGSGVSVQLLNLLLAPAGMFI